MVGATVVVVEAAAAVSLAWILERPRRPQGVDLEAT
jgi:hypothetical protein